MPAASCNHPIDTPVRRAPLKIGTTTASNELTAIPDRPPQLVHTERELDVKCLRTPPITAEYEVDAVQSLEQRVEMDLEGPCGLGQVSTIREVGRGSGDEVG
jgi:hypothetical protein